MGATKIIATGTKGVWTTVDGSIRITAKVAKRHGQRVTVYTATQNAGTPAWKDIAEATTLATLADRIDAAI